MTDSAGAAGAAHDAAVEIDTTPDPVDEERVAAETAKGRAAHLDATRDAVARARAAHAKAQAAADGAALAVDRAEAELAALESEA